MIDNYPCFFTLCSSGTPYGPSGADATGVPAIKRQTDQASLLATLQAALDSQSYAGTLTVDKELKLLLALPVGNQPFLRRSVCSLQLPPEMVALDKSAEQLP